MHLGRTHRFTPVAMYDPAIYYSRSICLKGYDYPQPGLYFITICVQDGGTCLEKERNGERHPDT